MSRSGPTRCLVRWLKYTGAAALLATSNSSLAQDVNISRAEERLKKIEAWAKNDFHTIVTEGNSTASWDEISRRHEGLLAGLSLSEPRVLEQFDHNNDGALQEKEYIVFISHLVDERLQQLRAGADDGSRKSSTDLSGAADELATEAVDDALVPDSTTATWADAPFVDSAGLTLPTVQGGYERVTFEALEDEKLVNLKGEVIGDIEDVVASKDESEIGLLVESGGFLGLATTDIFVPIKAVYIVGEQLVWETLMSADAVRAHDSFHYDDAFTSLMEE